MSQYDCGQASTIVACLPHDIVAAQTVISMSDVPLSLSDDQLLIVEQCAEPLPPADRGRYLEHVALLLRGVELGDGVVSRAARQAQSELFRVPQRVGLVAPRYGRGR